MPDRAPRRLFALPAAPALLAALVVALGCGSEEPHEQPRPPRAPRSTEDDVAGRPDDLAQRVAERIRALSPESSVERRDAAHVAVGEAVLDVSNLAEECRRAPDVCDAAIDRWARTAVAPDAVPAREAIRAVLLPIEAATTAREEAGARGGDEPLVGRPFAGRLFESFVIDEPDRIVHLSTRQLAELGNPSLDELHALALANMRRAFAAELPSQPFSDRAPDVRVISIGDSYENSRVLLHERWAPIARHVRGELLVAAPARDLVIYTGSGSARDVATLRWLAQQMTRNEPHPIAPTVLRWTPESWELFHANDVPDPAIEETLRASP